MKHGFRMKRRSRIRSHRQSFLGMTTMYAMGSTIVMSKNLLGALKKAESPREKKRDRYRSRHYAVQHVRIALNIKGQIDWLKDAPEIVEYVCACSMNMFRATIDQFPPKRNIKPHPIVTLRPRILNRISKIGVPQTIDYYFGTCESCGRHFIAMAREKPPVKTGIYDRMWVVGV